MPQTRVRVVGSGFTTLQYNGKDIAFLQSFADGGQRPVASAEAITPLNARHPVEIVTGRVLREGTITATITELWNQPVWYQMQGLAGRATIVDVWEAISQGGVVTCRMVIRPPNAPPRGKLYHGCVVTGIDDGETVQVGTLSVSKAITITYTHTTAI